MFSSNRLNNIFQLKAQSRLFTKSFFSLEAETLALFTSEKREVSSANSLTLAVRPREIFLPAERKGKTMIDVLGVDILHLLLKNL